MKLTEHFTIEEMTLSQEAERKGLDNNPGPEVIANLQSLCREILEPLRQMLDRPVIVTSGYRSPEVNAAIGGSTNPLSQHTSGQAADIHVNGMTAAELFDCITKSDLPFDQLIEEFGRWVHVSWSRSPRRDRRLARRENGKVIYPKAA